MTERLLYTVGEAAEAIAVSKSRLYELLAAGTVRSVKLGASRRIPVEALREFCSELQAAADDGVV